ncbi:raffinose/stachyose/melibiose transport system substrate-binding protein [Paenibacillus taihuensis]|uniref:Raffinose/stachyose/melibiose transport system substrate-binding protein n=1 Tax=Paenibacillus taihuensis TaxID=1156355 RepID=A0A3D9S9M0_9BACL|nr:extracellular solute-binding protein [Paenibacillus taihuensis]REE87526.1 raffinose/stachyose/melibiose transport system substrate-binding protein [Paenibacillus taihuensis]
MKRVSALVMTSALVALLASGCGSSNNTNNNTAGNTGTNTEAGSNAGTNNAGDKKPIKVFQFKVEIADQLNAMAAEYEKETGVHVEVETHGGGEDYGALLKAAIASGSEPEIINNGGYSSLVPYMDRATDLSDQPWVGNLLETTKAPTTVDGKLYGMPMNTEGFGLIYNKDLFQKAGITTEPKTLPELTDAVAKLKAAGITPFETTNEWWSLGIHLADVALANQPDPAKFIEDWKAGKVTAKGNPIFEKWVNLVDLIFKNAQKGMLTTDYATQVASFAAGKAAMMQQGNWTQGDIDKVNANLNLGVLPIPIDDQPGHVFVGVPNNWIVNSKSANAEGAKKFLDWMVSSDTGKKYLTKEFHFMPAETNIDATKEDIGSIAASIKDQNSTALGWHWDRFPDGTTQGFGAAMQEYQGGSITKDQLLEKFDKTVSDMMKK